MAENGIKTKIETRVEADCVIFEEPQQVMLAFYLSEKLAKAIAQPEREDPEDLHLTLAVFDDDDLAEVPIKRLVEALEIRCRTLSPLDGRISGTGRFSASESSDGLDVIYASFDSPDLLNFREALLEVADQKGLNPLQNHGYTPHITLAYVDPDAEMQVKLPALEVTFSVVTLATGEGYFDFELLGLPPEIPDKTIGVVQLASTAGSDWGRLSQEEVDKVNLFTPSSLEPLRADELVKIQVVGANNLINRSSGKWGFQELMQLAQLLPGLPFLLDHAWEDVSSVQGLIFQAGVEVVEIAPEAQPKTNPDYFNQPEFTYEEEGRNIAVFVDKTVPKTLQVVDRINTKEWNQKIVKEEGYITCRFDVAIPATSPVLQGIRFGTLSSVSLGGFRYSDHVCPLCKTSFMSGDCPHFIPEPWNGLTHDADPSIAPYYIRSGVFDLGEASLVPIGNLPGAAIKRRGTLISQLVI